MLFKEVIFYRYQNQFRFAIESVSWQEHLFGSYQCTMRLCSGSIEDLGDLKNGGVNVQVHWNFLVKPKYCAMWAQKIPLKPKHGSTSGRLCKIGEI